MWHLLWAASIGFSIGWLLQEIHFSWVRQKLAEIEKRQQKLERMLR
jgi:uncharacterized membrane protein YciS (DUF1049 family)